MPMIVTLPSGIVNFPPVTAMVFGYCQPLNVKPVFVGSSRTVTSFP